jgi:hypothetical protein
VKRRHSGDPSDISKAFEVDGIFTLLSSISTPAKPGVTPGYPKFFDILDHGHLRAFLDQRVRDGLVRRARNKWLRAGVMEEGQIRHEEFGTPQGGVISPLLANIHLHETLDG